VGNTSEKEVSRLTSVCHCKRVMLAVEKRERSAGARARAVEKRMKEDLKDSGPLRMSREKKPSREFMKNSRTRCRAP
jgi:hypothetical protein